MVRSPGGGAAAGIPIAPPGVIIAPPGLPGGGVPTALAALTAAIRLGRPLPSRPISNPPLFIPKLFPSLLSAGPIVKLVGPVDEGNRGPAFGPD